MESMFFSWTASGYEHGIQFGEGKDMYCPKCRENNGDNSPEDEDIECRKCKMVYRRSISRTSSQLPLNSSTMTSQTTLANEISVTELQLPENVSSSKMKRKTTHDEDYEMALFRRVRIQTSIELPAPDSRSGIPEYKEIYETFEPPGTAAAEYEEEVSERLKPRFNEAVPDLEYVDQLASFRKENGLNFGRFPGVDRHPLDLHQLKRAVEARRQEEVLREYAQRRNGQRLLENLVTVGRANCRFLRPSKVPINDG